MLHISSWQLYPYSWWGKKTNTKNTLVLFWFVWLTFCIQSGSKLCWLNLQNIPRIWPFPTTLVQKNYLSSGPCPRLPNWSCLLLPLWTYDAVSSSQIMSLLAQNLSMTFCPKSALIIELPLQLIYQYSSSHPFYSGGTDLALPKTLHRLVYFRAFVHAVTSALSSHCIPGGCSHTFFRYLKSPSLWDLHDLLIYNFKSAFIV